MKRNIIKLALSLTAILTVVGCTDLEEIWYDEVTPDTFFKSESDVYAALARPFTHARWYVVNDRWHVNEGTTDQFVWTQKGAHGYDGAMHARLLHHDWTPADSRIYETWRGTTMGIALALDVKNDLSQLDYEQFLLTDDDKDEHMGQLDCLIALFYLRGLDFFGGMPIFTSNEGENLPRNTDREVFDHVESLLTTSLPNLTKRTMGSTNEGVITQGAAAAMLVQLYFNAEAYVGESYDDEAEALCREIIAGDYGDYALATDWKDPFDFENHDSDEMLYGIPSEFNYLQYDWFYSPFYHYKSTEIFDIDGSGWNGVHLIPSRDPNGDLYTFNIGQAYERFHDDDLRKQPYYYNSGNDYTGMFHVGPQYARNGGAEVLGSEEYNGKHLIFVDQVARFSEGKTESTVFTGEENSGIRLVKVPTPNSANGTLRYGADHNYIRLTEIYYTLAELLYKKGDSQGAADIFNSIRTRNFAGGVDPNPVTDANLDKYRLAEEWGTEFLGEGRRRTDLIRWNMFVTEDWWDHTASNNENLNRFPVPTEAISGNNALEQNPGY